MAEPTMKVPALRFPGFDGEWEEKRLGEIASFAKGKGISKSDISANGNLECIRYGELYTYYNEVIDTVISRTKLSPETLILSKANDVIIPSSGETSIDIATASCILRDGIAIGGDLNIIRTSLNGIFLSYYLNNTGKISIARLAQGISVVHLYASHLNALELKIPPLPEQEKISTFLTAVDSRIQLLRQKKSALETYKQGVMQQLFSQELRFKDEDGNDFPEWEEKRLGDLFSFITTNSFSRAMLNDSSGAIKNIHYGDIHTKYLSHFDSKREIVPFINDSIDTSKLSKRCYLEKGDLVIADASEDYQGIGKMIEIIGVNNERIVAGLHTFLARPTQDETVIGFMGHYFQSKEIRGFIMRIAQGAKVLGISTTRLSKMPIRLPNKLEQQKIATFLSSLDDSIAKVDTLIQQSSAFKQGLLQKMFI